MKGFKHTLGSVSNAHYVGPCSSTFVLAVDARKTRRLAQLGVAKAVVSPGIRTRIRIAIFVQVRASQRRAILE